MLNINSCINCGKLLLKARFLERGSGIHDYGQPQRGSFRDGSGKVRDGYLRLTSQVVHSWRKNADRSLLLEQGYVGQGCWAVRVG